VRLDLKERNIEKNAAQYYKSSQTMFLPVTPLSLINGFVLKLGKNHYHFIDEETPFNNISTCSILNNKFRTNRLLELGGIPVPKSVSLHVSEFQKNKTLEKITHLKFPLVIKPLICSSKGKDVLCNIQSADALLKLLKPYFDSYDFVLIEEFHAHLNSYRVLLFNKKIIGVVQRFPAAVIGDGTHNIKELIEITNKKRKKGYDFLAPIQIDEECMLKLKELNLTLDYIPAPEERVVLGYTSNTSRGGSYATVKNSISKENKKIFIKAAALLNINLAGIDVECADIKKPITESNGVIIEVNQRPSIRIHEFPLHGKPLLVTKKIMRSFILRHPVAYLYSLYYDKRTAFYVRSLLSFILFGVLYFFIT